MTTNDITAEQLTEEHRAKLQALVTEMRQMVARAGPIPAWWNAISDMQALLNGRDTIVTMTPDEWIEQWEKRLAVARVLASDDVNQPKGR